MRTSQRIGITQKLTSWEEGDLLWHSRICSCHYNVCNICVLVPVCIWIWQKRKIVHVSHNPTHCHDVGCVFSHIDSSSFLVEDRRVFLLESGLSADGCESSASTECVGISSFPMMNLRQKTHTTSIYKPFSSAVKMKASIETGTTYFNAENAKPLRPSLLL